jgi:hypothetical protein
MQDQCTTASFSCPLSKREHSPGEFPLLLSHEQPLRKARHDTAHVLPDRIVTRVQLRL